MTPQQIVERAGSIVRGTVVGTRTLASGERIARAARRGDFALPPLAEERADHDPAAGEEAVAPVGRRALTAPDAPVGLGVEGGRMLFTEVTMEVAETIKGAQRSRLTFVVAGGRDDEVVVTVHGLPTFELGEELFLFLAPDLETTAEPVVGGHQGFFRVDRSQDGPRLIDHQGRLLVGMDASQFTTRALAGEGVRNVPGPVPDDPDVVTRSRSFEARQQARPLTPADLVRGIRSLDGEDGR